MMHRAGPSIVWLCALQATCCLAASPFDYHSVRGRQAKVTSGFYEAETDLVISDRKARPQGMQGFGDGWSGHSHLLWDGALGDALHAKLLVERTGNYRVQLQLTKAPDYGIFSVALDGNPQLQSIDLYATRVELASPVEFGPVRLHAGEHRLTFELTAANRRAKKFRQGYLLGVDYLRLVALDPLPAQVKPPRPDATKRTAAALTNEAFRKAMETHCTACHGEDESTVEGDLNLKTLLTPAALAAQLPLAEKIWSVLAQGTMPPEGETQPTAATRAGMLALLDGVIDRELAQRGLLEPVVMRRMNRYEYSNAVRDLLGMRGDIYPLPEKVLRASRPYFDPASGHFPRAIRVGNRTLGKNQVEKQILTGVSPFAIDLQAEHGFNNRGSDLSVSPLLLESFLKLGLSIVNSPEFDDYCTQTEALFRAPEGAMPAAETSLARARLAKLLRRAFRRETEPATVERYVNFFLAQRQTKSFADAMKQVVAAVLGSPRFLYLMERKHGAAAEARTSGYELATRLSFFLWSSIPDDELLGAAERGDLADPQQRAAQVRRMLEDPRSQALSQNFARQWLRLDQLITAVPDFERFPAYYSRIGCEQWKLGLQTMVEPLLLFESILVEDRSIMLLLDSNYSYRSDDLHSWYRDTTPFSGRNNRNRFDTFQQVYRRRPLSTRREGGVLTTAAVLTMTSSPLRTNPISRGAWVATVIFNQPPPPPPDVIPEIEADDVAIEAQGITLRQRLEQHRSDAGCASCHQKIDPLGFVLENYDAVGRWRDAYTSGLPIDTQGKLFGDTPFADIEAFKTALLARPETFTRAFCEHLLAYALGRDLVLSDRRAVDKITQRVLEARGQFSTVVLEITGSYPFLHKTNQQERRP